MYCLRSRAPFHTLECYLAWYLNPLLHLLPCLCYVLHFVWNIYMHNIYTLYSIVIVEGHFILTDSHMQCIHVHHLCFCLILFSLFGLLSCLCNVLHFVWNKDIYNKWETKYGGYTTLKQAKISLQIITIVIILSMLMPGFRMANLVDVLQLKLHLALIDRPETLVAL